MSWSGSQTKKKKEGGSNRGPSSAYSFTHTHAPNKRFQFSKCQQMITMWRQTPQGGMGAQGPDVMEAGVHQPSSGTTFGVDLRPGGERERPAKALAANHHPRSRWTFNSAAASLKPRIYSQTPRSQPFITPRLPFISLSSVAERNAESVIQPTIESSSRQG